MKTLRSKTDFAMKINIKKIQLMVLALSPLATAAQDLSAFGNVAEGIELNTDKIHNIYIAPGINTSIRFLADEEVAQVFIGEEIISVDYDSSTNAIQLRAVPGYRQGMTNMNVVIDNSIYVFLVQIVEDTRVQYTVNCTFPGRENGNSERRFPPAAKVKPIKPMDLDTVGAIRAIERGRIDPVYRSQNSSIFTFPIQKVYYWNKSYVQLVDAHYFQNMDLMVLKVEWTNRDEAAHYLHANQVEVWVANNKVPVTARQQGSNLLFPGQRDSIYLFMQGLGINVDNNWELRLPPESTIVSNMLKQ